MILNVTKYETVEKGCMVSYEIGTEEKPTQQSGSFYCERLYHSVMARQLIDVMNEHREIKKLVFSATELVEKQDKIITAIKRSETHTIRPGGRVVRKRKLFETFTDDFYNERVLIKEGKYEGKHAYIKSFDDWGWIWKSQWGCSGQMFTLTVELEDEKEDVTVIERQIKIVEYQKRREWYSKLDMIPDHETLANDIGYDCSISGNDMNKELDKKIIEIEDTYGTIVDFCLSELRKDIKRRGGFFSRI